MKIKENLTLANLVTSTRILLTPLFVKEILTGGRISAAIILAAVVLTDLLDGHLARRRGAATTLGKILDPCADAFFMLSGLLTFTILGYITLIQFVLLIFAAALRFIGLYLIYTKKKQIHSTRWSKLSAAMNQALFLWFLLELPFATWAINLTVLNNLLIGAKRNYDGLKVTLGG